MTSGDTPDFTPADTSTINPDPKPHIKPDPKPDKVSTLQDHLGYWLRYVSNNVSLNFKQRVEAQDVTVAQWVLLRELYDLQQANPSQLAEKLGMTRGAISKLIDRLCEKNLIYKAFSQHDRRYQHITLTDSGRKLVPTLAKLADENDHAYFGHLTENQKFQLLSTLKQIVQRQKWNQTPVD